MLQTQTVETAKALTYFDEIDFEEAVVMTSSEFNWGKVAKRLQDMAKNPQKVFKGSL